MKRDLNHLMKEKGIAAIFAILNRQNDPVMYYLLNGVHLSGYYLKKIDSPAYLIHHPMEREEAKKTGLKLVNINRYKYWEVYNRNPDMIKALAVLINKILVDFDIKGKIAFYGNMAIGNSHHLLKKLKTLNKKIEISYEPQRTLITEARMTKDEDEIVKIKRVRDGVISAFTETLKLVQKMKTKGQYIYQKGNKKLLIGDLKKMLHSKLFEHGLINSAGLIVSQGYDAGVPHNSGKDNQPVMLGKTIVFDIFPQAIESGYYFDFTRTVCFGFAPEDIKKEYKVVKEAQDIAIANLKVGRRTREIELAVCNFFEKNGHPTLLKNPKAQNGYCHSLGHGIGVNVHESPAFGLLKTNYDYLERGMVFTIEPGLYYPEKGYGIRLEDVVYIDRRGKIINLTNFPKDLIVEMKI